MKRVMYMVEIATYENGKDIMDHETIRKKIYESLKANNATVRIAQMEYGVVRLLTSDGKDVTDVFGCMNRKWYDLKLRPECPEVQSELDKCKEELDRYRKAFEGISAIGPSASVETYITAVCRAEKIVNGDEA